MPNTPRLGLRYPALTDAPNGPQALQNLGLDVEGWLNRAFPCTSTTRPGSPLPGLIIYETDTGQWRGWTGSAWEQIGGTSGGGAAPVVADAQFSASTAQNVATGGVGTVVAFGAEQIASPYVERETLGSGHRFRLLVAGLWAVSATIRFAKVAGADGELSAGLYSGANAHDGPTPEPLALGSGGDEGSAPTYTWSVPRRFTADTRLYVVARQVTGVTRSLERGTNGATVRINFALVGR